LATKTPKGNFTSLEGSRTHTISVAEVPTRAPPNAAEPTRRWLTHWEELVLVCVRELVYIPLAGRWV
jgi:hypothetical protein